MQLVHYFALVFKSDHVGRQPVRALLGTPDATALKPPHKAGRRGGVSIAR